MAITPSIGDVLMLSQLSWKIGCAFTAGRNGAPAQFHAVEKELKGLTNALTLLAESLDHDSSILDKCDRRTKDGIAKILGCCQQSLSNLQSFVSQYQEVVTVDDLATTAVRSWKRVLIRNYEIVMWTTEGGTIQSLRNMLAMHTQSISIATQALQSRSLSRLERIIQPVADQVGGIYDKVNGDLDGKIDDIHNALTALRLTTDIPSSPTAFSKKPRNMSQRDANGNARLFPSDSISLRSSHRQLGSSGLLEAGTPLRRAGSTASEWSDGTTMVQRPPGSLTRRFPSYHSRSASPDGPITPTARSMSRQGYNIRSKHPNSDAMQTTYQDEDDAVLYSRWPALRLPPTGEDPIFGNVSLELDQEALGLEFLKGDALEEQRMSFERALFENAAVLCDFHASSLDYTQPDGFAQGDFIMQNACTNSRVFIIRKPQKLPSGARLMSTSIWTISQDGKTRVQHKLPYDEDIVPYTVWGSECKVVLRLEVGLKFHGSSIDLTGATVAKTSWVTYAFESEREATTFQNALFNKNLVLTVKTKSTMRIHDGISGAFAFAEQLCGLENLRLFTDPSTGTSIGMIHYTPAFNSGYMKFPLNNVFELIRVREESDTVIRIKGLKIPVVKSVGKNKSDNPVRITHTASRQEQDGTTSVKAKPDKIITGAKIEFYTPLDKTLFMAKLKEIQDSYHP